MNEEPYATLPVLPLKGAVLYPRLTQTIAVGRPLSIAAVEAAHATEDKEVFVVAQREAGTELPSTEDLFTVGTRATIKRIHRLPTVKRYSVEDPATILREI